MTEAGRRSSDDSGRAQRRARRRRDVAACAGAAAGALLLALGLSACTAVDPSAKWARVQGLATPQTAEPLHWSRTEADADRIDAEVATLLAPGMSRQAAIRVALLNNPDLQAEFEEIGIAQADLVQAGLLTNPSLSAFVAFPLVTANSAAALMGAISDLWLAPAREAVAEATADATVLEVAAAVVATAADAGDAYDEVLYRQALLAVERQNLELRAASVARGRKASGDALADQLAMNRTEAEEVQQELAVAQAEARLSDAKDCLAETLGVLPSRLPSLGDVLEPSPRGAWSVETAVHFALEHRLDVAAARHEVVAAERRLALERRQVFGEVDFGPGYGGGFGTGDAGGPALQLDVPIFDQNQAQIAKAEFELRRRRKKLAALEARARHQVRKALVDIALHGKHVEIYRTRLEPMQSRAAQQAESLGATNETFALHALDARQEEIDGRRGYLEAVRELRGAHVDLDRALWSGRKSD